MHSRSGPFPLERVRVQTAELQQTLKKTEKPSSLAHSSAVTHTHCVLTLQNLLLNISISGQTHANAHPRHINTQNDHVPLCGVVVSPRPIFAAEEIMSGGKSLQKRLWSFDTVKVFAMTLNMRFTRELAAEEKAGEKDGKCLVTVEWTPIPKECN